MSAKQGYYIRPRRDVGHDRAHPILLVMDQEEAEAVLEKVAAIGLGPLGRVTAQLVEKLEREGHTAATPSPESRKDAG